MTSIIRKATIIEISSKKRRTSKLKKCMLIKMLLKHQSTDSVTTNLVVTLAVVALAT